MRTIEISLEVYAAIWGARRPGEANEDDILKRLLGIETSAKLLDDRSNSTVPVGYKDPRFNVEMPEGFEIFRVYKGIEYRAKATQGQFELASTGQRYRSLNQLSKAVSGNIENAWRNWYFIGRDGKRHLVEGLRADVPRNVRHLV